MKEYQLLNNSRFYVLTSAIILSVLIVSWVRLSIETDQLFFIRTEQIFGLVSILYWYLALIISPIGYVIGKQRTKRLEFSRRAIGVSAAYYAVLHMSFALWGQLGGIGSVKLLPPLFQWSLLGGFIAVIILLLMAATSFDKVIDFMTFGKWKWLHRLVYAGGILAVLHVWSVGTHVSYSAVQILALIALVILSGLESFRFITLLSKKYSDLAPKPYFVTAFTAVWIIWIGLILAIPLVIQTYHGSQMKQSTDASSNNYINMDMNMQGMDMSGESKKPQ